jgi:pimeloyl-ACP methyl ester carboxylesterase
MGGSVGMLVATRLPYLVSRLMVVVMIPFMGAFYGPPGRVDSAEVARPIAEGVRAGTLAETPDARRANLTGMVAKMARTEAERPRLVENGVASDPRVMAGVMYDMILLDLRGELRNIRVPVTVLYVHAPLIRLDAAQTDAIYRTMFSTVPNARLARIDDAYHFIMLDQPERFAAELKGFLAP